jgi:hypothetical protein
MKRSAHFKKHEVDMARKVLVDYNYQRVPKDILHLLTEDINNENTVRDWSITRTPGQIYRLLSALRCKSGHRLNKPPCRVVKTDSAGPVLSIKELLGMVLSRYETMENSYRALQRDHVEQTKLLRKLKDVREAVEKFTI